ncbi:unnamed protein product [Acanthosepion pharaonis]|uniref:Fatty acyl-CoA reductase n=1 Tax=Acanthosepion pharaonis TaxID=158019 RepID=A0A812CJW4_ACAPH|nr:unnamed protein product [Sepia pharaonis]
MISCIRGDAKDCRYGDHYVIWDSEFGSYTCQSYQVIGKKNQNILSSGAYLPLDISFPQRLVDNILVEATPKVILTTSELRDQFPADFCVICLDENFLEQFKNGNDKVVSFPMNWDNLAYIAYSSGTTGKPKGIMCPHKGAILSYKWRHENYPYAADEREACNIFFHDLHGRKFCPVGCHLPQVQIVIMNEAREVQPVGVSGEAVEVCLTSLPEVNNCVVLVNGDEGENKFLVAYIVPNGEVTRKDIRSQLKKKLPFYMIPSYFLFLKSIPVVPASGKLDKKALPEYDSQVEISFSSEGLPNTDTEKKLAQIWKNVLQLRNIDIEESFFDLGGIDMSLRAFWRSFRVGNRWNKGRVLVTGGSGFLGAFLIRELLLNTKTFIYCLIREHPDVSAHCRLINSLKKFGILAKDEKKGTEKQKIIAKLLPNRLATVKGDVAIVNLGMNEEEYMHMCTEVDFIIHAAASVNLAYPYIALQGPNVLGTQNVVLFAFTGKVKPLHHISTDGVFPHGLTNCGEDEDIAVYHNQLTEGYSQSKWVAELLVERARKRGLPAVIYRLGNLSGDRENVSWNPQDFTLLMLQACAMYKVAPEENWSMEMTPVDFTANVIVRITQDLAQAVGKTLHLINTKPAKSKDIHFFSKLSTYTNSHLQEILLNFDLTYPETDSAFLRLYFDKLSRQGIFPSPSRMSIANTSLHGKVVIVTGASSGIGAAIAEALIKAGANVALAARRIDKLKDLCKKLEEDGSGLAIAVKTDVTNKEDVKELVRHTECSLGSIDVLVNSAGVMYYTLMKNLKENEWEQMIDINCKGFAGLAVYSGSKFFVEGLSQALRQEVVSSGIKVTCLQPGDVKTELIGHTTDQEAKEMYDGSILSRTLHSSRKCLNLLFSNSFSSSSISYSSV